MRSIRPLTVNHSTIGTCHPVRIAAYDIVQTSKKGEFQICVDGTDVADAEDAVAIAATLIATDITVVTGKDTATANAATAATTAVGRMGRDRLDLVDPAAPEAREVPTADAAEHVVIQATEKSGGCHHGVPRLFSRATAYARNCHMLNPVA